MNKISILAAASTTALLLSCLSAAAVETVYKVPSSAPVAEVWKKIGDFCGIGTWHPAIAKCELSKDGKERTLTLKSGGTIVEPLVKWNDKAHSYTYRIKTSPLPVEHYISTLKVVKKGKGSLIIWSAHFKAKGASDAEANKTIEGIFKGGADALAM